MNSLEKDYDSTDAHKFSKEFKNKIQCLKHRADHPVLYKAVYRAASVVLAVLIGCTAWLTVDTDARAAFFGWVNKVYETHFSYHFSKDTHIIVDTNAFDLSWIPEGYVKHTESDFAGSINTVYKNKEGLLLKFHYIYELGPTSLLVDADGGTIKKAKVADYDADLVLFDTNKTANSIIWKDENNIVFHISAFLNEDDLIKIANSVYNR